MSLVRIHNFSISLDGFGTGKGQSKDAHFGHAGDRLHEWMFATRRWQPAVAAASTTSLSATRFGDRRRDHGCREVRPSRMARGSGLEGRLGSQSAVPYAGLRPHPSPAGADRDGRRYDIPLHRCLAGRGARAASEAADGQDVRIGGGATVIATSLPPGWSTTCTRLWSRSCWAEEFASGTEWRPLRRVTMEATASPSGVTHLTFTRAGA